MASPKPRYSHFNWIAPFYDRIFASLSHQALVDHLQVGPNQTVLDIGGGTGRVAAKLRMLGGWIIVVDPSPVMLAHAQAKSLAAARALAEELPFTTDSIDRIYVVDAFHHFADQAQAARELVRVLRPSGRLVIEEPDVRHRVVRFAALAEKLALMQSRFYSPAELGQLFTAAGAQVLDITPDRFSAHIVLTKAARP